MVARPERRTTSPARRTRPKIQVPDLPPGSLVRTEVIFRIDQPAIEGAPAPVALVCAPAGYGKTTAITQWARSRIAREQPVAWVTCDGRDCDVEVLFADIRDAFALAFHSVPTHIGEAGLASVARRCDELAAPSEGGVESPIEELIAILAEYPGPVGLALDDFHSVVGLEAAAAVEYLLRHAPANLRVVVGSRVEPNPMAVRMRLRGQLVEFDTEDLAFGPDQVDQLLVQAGLPGTELAPVLTDQTEGWPAAVQLGILALGRDHSTAQPMRVGDEPAVSEYLTAEILAALPEDVTEVLRQSAVVPEMTAELATALTGRVDAGGVLENLYRAHTLVRRVGTVEPWYSLHALLRDHLLAELARTDVNAPSRQHRKAAVWFAAQDRPRSALEHARASQDTAVVIDLLTAHGLRLLLAGSAQLVDEALRQVGTSNWGADLVGLAALARLEVGDVAAARRVLEMPAGNAGSDLPTPRSDCPSLSRIAAFWVRRLEGNATDQGLPSAFADVLGWFPDPNPSEGHLDQSLLLLVNRGRWAFAVGRYEDSWRDLRQALDLARSHRRDGLALHCLGTLAAVPAFEEDAIEVTRFVDESLDLIEARGWKGHPAVANLYAVGAWAAHVMMQPERAEQLIGLARAAADSSVDPEYAVTTALVDAMLTVDRPAADPKRALRFLARLAAGAPGTPLTPHLRSFAGFTRVRIHLARGDIDSAARAVADLERWLPGIAEPHLGRALVAMETEHWAAAREFVRPIAAMSLEVKVVNTTAAALLVECLCAAALGAHNTSREALLKALDEVGPRGSARTFYDFGPRMRESLREHQGRLGRHEPFVAEILTRWSLVDAFREVRSTDPATTGQGINLTRRELDVLRELPSMMTVEEIAAEHVVSVNTIRTQMRTLYKKLGVRTRREAVQRGRQLGVLS